MRGVKVNILKKKTDSPSNNHISLLIQKRKKLQDLYRMCEVVHGPQNVKSDLIIVPFSENAQAGQEEGHCSGGDTHHSASGNVLQREFQPTF